MTFLAQWYDPALKVGDEKQKEVEAQEIERLQRQLAISRLAQEIPRRTGADASAEDLALDKRRAKRIGHALSQCLAGWNGKEVAGGDDLRPEAAQIDWQKWWGEHQTWLQNRIRYIVNWARKNGVEERWVKSAVVRLQNEMRWLAYALRE